MQDDTSYFRPALAKLLGWNGAGEDPKICFSQLSSYRRAVMAAYPLYLQIVVKLGGEFNQR